MNTIIAPNVKVWGWFRRAPAFTFGEKRKTRAVSEGGNNGYSAITRKAGNDTSPPGPWGNLRHKLEDILVIGLAALLCNGEDFEDMEAFGLEREAELRKFLELPERIPDGSTFFRVFQRVNPKELLACLYSWVAEARELRQPDVTIGGKTIRGSGRRGEDPVHAVSVREPGNNGGGTV
jgi:hypothetical protein